MVVHGPHRVEALRPPPLYPPSNLLLHSILCNAHPHLHHSIAHLRVMDEIHRDSASHSTVIVEHSQLPFVTSSKVCSLSNVIVIVYLSLVKPWPAAARLSNRTLVQAHHLSGLAKAHVPVINQILRPIKEGLPHPLRGLLRLLELHLPVACSGGIFIEHTRETSHLSLTTRSNSPGVSLRHPHLLRKDPPWNSQTSIVTMYAFQCPSAAASRPNLSCGHVAAVCVHS